jgi:dipeptidyl aminopeptidase/acylaminoacyl peptidase
MTTAERIRALFAAIDAPGHDKLALIEDFDVAPGGEEFLVAGLTHHAEAPRKRRGLFVADRASGAVRALAAGSGGGAATLGSYSPDGMLIAAVVHGADRSEIHIMDRAEAAVGAPCAVDGIVEAIAWAPDSRHLLVCYADAGADQAGSAGSSTLGAAAAGSGDWMPETGSSDTPSGWRRAASWSRAHGSLTWTSPDALNIWEAAWLGTDALVVVASDLPEERHWYTAELVRLDLSGSVTRLYRGTDQIGLVAGSPDGRRIAFVEAVASDRGVLCGTAKLIDSSGVHVLPTGGVDVSCLAWRDSDAIVFCGLRGLAMVVGETALNSTHVREHFVNAEIQAGFYFPYARPVVGGGVAVAAEGFGRPPSLTVLGDGTQSTVLTTATSGTDLLASLFGSAQQVAWRAPDGLEIQGWLLTPAQGRAPYPLVMEIHGGPVWCWRSVWLGRMPLIPALLSEGFAVFLPNPRGSTGRGHAFAAAVRGDMGGLDTHDYLSGLDALVERGLADPDRLYATGSSYGGYMSAWLVTQDNRFAAAAPRCPVINWTTQHYTANIGDFDRLFLDSDPADPSGRHATRSPVNRAAAVNTPVLITAGALDRCTPPTQAAEFFEALSEAGVRAELVVYPQEGHGTQGYEARADVAARLIDWFQLQRP